MGSYKSCQAGSYSSTDSSSSKSTAATIHSERTVPKPHKNDWVPSSTRRHTYRSEAEAEVKYESREQRPRSSTSTYASTTNSIAELDPEPQQTEASSPHEGRYCVNERQEFYPLDAIPSTPSSFAPLFPSSRRLLIRHDDTTIDGNMNLRVDTPVHLRDGSQRDVILFHLRMYDLFSRKFSFRRYCRDSGREVCHSARREVVPAHERRPALRTSWSNVFAGFRPGSAGCHCQPNGELKRQDSGHGAGCPHGNRHGHSHGHGLAAGEEVDEKTIGEDELEKEKEGQCTLPILGETILLEFSNYAHVELRRKGPGSTKKYEFEYWSTKYQWRREVRKEGDLHEVSYFLVDTRTSKTIAHLVPDTLAPLEVVEEESKGGWVPPSSLWISDPEVCKTMPDVADVIVATGIVALVDDCIRRRWHHERRPSWILPAQHSLAKSLERMGPRRLIGQVLQRRGSA